MNLQQLNEEYGIKGQLEFLAGEGGLVMADISNQYATARVSLYGGQVLSYCLNDASHDLMFNSEKAYYHTGKAIKGGVPVCWPWFGPDPEGKGRPAHGFARTSQWDVKNTASESDGSTRLMLKLSPNEISQSIWPNDFELTLEITVGPSLQLVLKTTNKNDYPLTITQALHTYFQIGDITKVSVEGLDGNSYIDKVKEGVVTQQRGQVSISGEVDRIYTEVNNDLMINDGSYLRKIKIHSTGSNSAVVWNPWAEIAAGMADLNDDDYKNMLCVETTNADPDVITIAAGQSHTISANYRIEVF